MVDRETISSKSTIVKLSGSGIAVTSLNAELFVEFLADLLVANITIIPIKKRSAIAQYFRTSLGRCFTPQMPGR